MSSEKPLRLDPGAAPRRKSITGCKCLLITAAILISIGVLLALVEIARGMLQYGSDPHSALYQNASLADVKDRGSVVQPLISREQTFDIVATVWLRSGEGVGHSVFLLNKMGKNDIDSNGSPNELDVQEIPLFSDVVFSGVRLTDKNIFTTIKYQLPTAIFRGPNLTNYDVRGSFMLIPSSPSLLDHLTNFTTWIPDTMQPLPVRSWPFPLGSLNRSDKTLVDEAIETFGISVPLLQFQNIKSRCLKSDETTSEKTSSETHMTTEGVATNTSIDMEDDPEDLDDSKDETNDRLGKETKGRFILENHPYVVTRTQVRVVDQTKLFNRKAYSKAHKQLKKTSCGQARLGIKPNRYMCDLNYRVNGHWGTQLKLETLNDITGKPQTEWAYAPFMSTTKRPLGPKDIQPVPVYREKCKTYLNETQPGLFIEQEFMNVIWKVAYSGRTPLKNGALDMVEGLFPKKLNTSESEYNQVLKQDSAELYSGVAGHLFEEGIQPRRRAILRGISTVLAIITSILDIRYWYTRTSTVSISIPGCALEASCYIIESIGDSIKYGKENDLSIIGWISWCLYFGVISFSLPILMIKAIARTEFGWRGTTWIPTMRIMSATHRERASERLDAKMPLRWKIALLLSITLIYYFLAPHAYHVIPALLPRPSPGDLNESRYEHIAPFALHPIFLTGKILQLLLNWRSKTYAGSHRISVALAAVIWLMNLAEFVPALVGRFDARGSLSIRDVLEIAWITAACWQAMSLPSVLQVSDDEHID